MVRCAGGMRKKAWVLAGILWCAGSAFAQSTTSLRGTITDARGLGLPAGSLQPGVTSSGEVMRPRRDQNNIILDARARPPASVPRGSLQFVQQREFHQSESLADFAANARRVSERDPRTMQFALRLES